MKDRSKYLGSKHFKKTRLSDMFWYTIPVIYCLNNKSLLPKVCLYSSRKRTSKDGKHFKFPITNTYDVLLECELYRLFCRDASNCKRKIVFCSSANVSWWGTILNLNVCFATGTVCAILVYQNSCLLDVLTTEQYNFKTTQQFYVR